MNTDGRDDLADSFVVVRLQQIVDIRSYFRRVTLPRVFPVVIDFPAWAGQCVTVLCTPLANRTMRLRQTCIRPEMHRRGNGAGGHGGAEDVVLVIDRGSQLDAHFKIHLIIQIERDKPARPRDLFRLDGVPHHAAGVRNDFGQFLQARPTPHNGKWVTADLFASNVICHLRPRRLKSEYSMAGPAPNHNCEL